jgi:hypothetical protein
VAAFPEWASEEDLAYCLGAAMGVLESRGPSLLVLCLSTIKERAWELCRADPSMREPSTSALPRLVFGGLVVCPPPALEPMAASVVELVEGVDTPQTRYRVLQLLRDAVTGQVEPVRQSRLAKFLLRLVDRSSVCMPDDVGVVEQSSVDAEL